MRNWKRGFGNIDLLLFLIVAGLVIGGFYFVFHSPEQTPSAKPEITAGAPKEPVETASRVTPETSAGKVPPAASRPVKEASGKPAPAAAPPAVQPTATGDDGEGAFSIEGTVYSLSSGMPLADCKVTFGDRAAVTGPDGEFRLTADGGVGALRFTCPKYRPETISRFNIEAGSGMAVFDVYLSGRRDVTRGRIEINGITGRVYDKATGAPLHRAWVTVGRKRTRTDKAGFFELWGNDTGLASLKVSAPGHIGEMVSGLDFNNLVNPLYYEISLEPDGGGKFHFALVGIGARLMPDPEGHGCRVAEVLENSPAAREGLEAGDHLLAVDGVAVDEASTTEIVELIRGREGEPVDLLVERQGEILRITCIRERVLY
jgi:hypothetical protein